MQSIGRVTGGARTGTTHGAARGGSGVSIAAGGGTAAREAMAAAEVVAPGLGLLALQEAGSGAERDAAAYQRASAILEELNGLQSALLGGGGDDPGRLRADVFVVGRIDPAPPSIRMCIMGDFGMGALCCHLCLPCLPVRHSLQVASDRYTRS